MIRWSTTEPSRSGISIWSAQENDFTATNSPSGHQLKKVELRSCRAAVTDAVICWNCMQLLNNTAKKISSNHAQASTNNAPPSMVQVWGTCTMFTIFGEVHLLFRVTSVTSWHQCAKSALFCVCCADEIKMIFKSFQAKLQKSWKTKCLLFCCINKKESKRRLNRQKNLTK